MTVSFRSIIQALKDDGYNQDNSLDYSGNSLKNTIEFVKSRNNNDPAINSIRKMFDLTDSTTLIISELNQMIANYTDAKTLSEERTTFLKQHIDSTFTNSTLLTKLKTTFVKTLEQGVDSNLLNKLRNPLIIKDKTTAALESLNVNNGTIFIILDNSGDKFVCNNYSIIGWAGKIEIEVLSKDANNIKTYSLKTGELEGALGNNLLSDASNNNKDGTFYNDDNGLMFFWGSAFGGNSSSSSGDPYIYSLLSNIPVKLPNLEKYYRLYENVGENVFINCSVSQATLEHQHRMIEFAKKRILKTHNIICDGYFYDSFWFSSENNYIYINLRNKKLTMNTNDYFKINVEQNKEYNCSDFSSYCSKVYISWNNSITNKLYKFAVLFFSNPHIENGIEYICAPCKKSIGLLIRNYKPKLLQVPHINTGKYKKIHRKLKKSKNIYYNKNIKGKNEKWHFSKK